MTISLDFIIIEVSLGNFVNCIWRKNVLENNFYMDNFFLDFLFVIYFSKHSKYLYCHKTDYAHFSALKSILKHVRSIFIKLINFFT